MSRNIITKWHKPLLKLQGQRPGLWRIPEQGQQHSWLQRMIQYPHLSASCRKSLLKCNQSENLRQCKKSFMCILMLRSMNGRAQFNSNMYLDRKASNYNKSLTCYCIFTSKKLSCLKYLQVTAFPKRQAFVPTALLTIQYPFINWKSLATQLKKNSYNIY